MFLHLYMYLIHTQIRICLKEDSQNKIHHCLQGFLLNQNTNQVKSRTLESPHFLSKGLAHLACQRALDDGNFENACEVLIEKKIFNIEARF